MKPAKNPAPRRAAVADLPQRLLAALAHAPHPLTARELGAAVGVRQDVALRAIRPALCEGRVVSSYGCAPTGRQPLAFSLAPAAPPPARGKRWGGHERPTAAARACLGCGKTFASEGARNRLCGPCRGRAARMSGAGPFCTPHCVRYR